MNSHTQRLQHRRPGRRHRMRARRADRDAAAARRGGGLPSAPAARRHDGQQGRADAGARLRAAGLPRACASTSAASAPRRAAGTRAAARSTTRWPWSPRRVAQPGAPLVLAGFSFGGYVAVAGRGAAGRRRQRGASAWCWSAPATPAASTSPPVPADTLVIHGEADDVVPLAATLDWARPQSLPVIVSRVSAISSTGSCRCSSPWWSAPAR